MTHDGTRFGQGRDPLAPTSSRSPGGYYQRRGAISGYPKISWLSLSAQTPTSWEIASRASLASHAHVGPGFASQTSSRPSSRSRRDFVPSHLPAQSGPAEFFRSVGTRGTRGTML